MAASSLKPATLSPRTAGLPKEAFGKREMLVRAPAQGCAPWSVGGKWLEDLDVHQAECFISSSNQELLPGCIFWVQRAGMQLVVPSHQVDAVEHLSAELWQVLISLICKATWIGKHILTIF